MKSPGGRRGSDQLLPPALRACRGAAAVLLVSCPDRRSLVAAVAQLLHGHGANILEDRILIHDNKTAGFS